MKWILRNKLLALLIGLVLYLGISLVIKSKKLDKVQAQNNYLLYKDSIQVGKTKSGDTTYTVYIPDKRFVPLKKYDSLLNELSIRPKDTRVVTQIKTETRVDTLIVKSTDTVKQEDPTYHYRYNTKNLSFDAEANQRLQITNLHIPDELSIVQYQEKGLLKTTITNSNPLVDITGINSVSYKLPDKPHKFGIGLSAGVGLNSKGLTPIYGLTLNYNLFTF